MLTRNRAGIAMRAGMTGDWAGAVQAFDARHYQNRLGIDAVRADEPGEVQAALTAKGASVVAWYEGAGPLPRRTGLQHGNLSLLSPLGLSRS